MQNIFESQAPFPHYVYEKRLRRLQVIAMKKIKQYYKMPIRFCQISFIFISIQFFSLFIIKETIFIGLILGLFFISLFSFTALCQLIHKKSQGKAMRLIEAFLEQCAHLAVSLDDPLAPHLISIQGLDMLFNQFELSSRFFPKWLSILEKGAYPILSKYEKRFCSSMIKQILNQKSQKIIALISLVPGEISFHAKLALCFIQKAKHFEMAGEKNDEIQLYKKAIDELKIVESFLTDKTWVLQKLAFCYEKIDQADFLIEALERLNFLHPSDHTILKKLAILYFRNKQRAKGLEIYEKLRYNDPELGKELIAFYSEQL